MRIIMRLLNRRWRVWVVVPLTISILLLSTASHLPAQERPVTNQDILDLLWSGISEQRVLVKIARSGCECDASPDSILSLRRAGATDKLILAVINAPGVRQEAGAEPARTAWTAWTA